MSIGRCNPGTRARVYASPSSGLAASHGRGDRRLLLILITLVAGALALIRLDVLGAREGPGHERAPESSPPALPTAETPPPSDGIEGTGRIEVGIDLPYKDLPRSFDGVGHVFGDVEVLGGLPFPDRWTLVVEPSEFGTAREHAERRVREYDGAERTFDVPDLPLGGYRIYAEAEGLNSRPQEILLFALAESPIGGAKMKKVTLHLSPPGSMTGAVVDESGAPVGDLTVFLEDMGDRSQRSTVTSPDGTWRIEGLRDARYKLYYHKVEQPLIPVQQINYIAPVRNLDDDVVPVTASVAFQILDDHKLTVMGARVRGFGRPQGYIACESGPDGVAIARFLPKGRYRVSVEHPDGLEGRADFELEGHEVGHEVEVRVRPSKQ